MKRAMERIHENMAGISAMFDLADTLRGSLVFAIQAALCSLSALWIAMWLQLDSPYWAASTVLITAQAARSQSLLKAVNRAVGTMVGLLASIVIVAVFPQHWWAFALALSGWIGLCTYVSYLLRALQAYAAALSGYTAVIVLMGSFGAPENTFHTALSRGSTVFIGVSLYSITALLLIPARSVRRLRESFETLFADVGSIVAEVWRGDAGARAGAGLLAGFAELDEEIEEAATDGLWPSGTKERVRRAALAMADLVVLSLEAPPAVERGSCRDPRAPSGPTAHTHEGERANGGLNREWTVIDGQVSFPEQRHGAAANSAIVQARAGLELLRTGVSPVGLDRVRRAVHREYLMAAYAAARSFLATLAALSFWILSRWPSGESFVQVVGIVCCLFATRPAPVANGLRFTAGTLATTMIAMVLVFFIIPRIETFEGLAATLFPFLFFGAFCLKSRKLAPYATPGNFFLVSMIDLQNPMSYEPVVFFNSVFATFCGCCAAVVAFALLPPPSTRIEASVLRWWIERDARRPIPRSDKRRERRRMRLYDRAGMLMSKLPPQERGPAFEEIRSMASRLQDQA